MSETLNQSPPPGVTIAPSPWVMPNVEAWWLITALAGSGADDVPPGNFDPLERKSRDEATGGNFQGGSGMVQVVRYSNGPVGPYDELIMTPGMFTSSVAPTALRITRIYVSTLASVYNGRKNWNIPKHLAKFSFTPSETINGATEIRVFAPKTIDGENSAFEEKPFFAALAKPSMLPIPAIPMNSSYSPKHRMLVQPPLESSSAVAKDGLIGTDKWCSIQPVMVGKIKPVRISGLLEDVPEDSNGATPPAQPVKRKRFANGIDFPDIDPYSTGVYWTNATLTFPDPTFY